MPQGNHKMLHHDRLCTLSIVCTTQSTECPHEHLKVHELRVFLQPKANLVLSSVSESYAVRGTDVRSPIIQNPTLRILLSAKILKLIASTSSPPLGVYQSLKVWKSMRAKCPLRKREVLWLRKTIV